MIPKKYIDMAADIMAAARSRGWTIGTAESCTGGLISACFTEVPGSSDVFDRGFVTYSNGAKRDVLGVSREILVREGAVSEAAARAMAEGVLAQTPVDLSVAVTGIAGPTGGSPDKPVGTVHMASACRDGETVHRLCQFGDLGRAEVRWDTVEAALALMRTHLE